MLKNKKQTELQKVIIVEQEKNLKKPEI